MESMSPGEMPGGNAKVGRTSATVPGGLLARYRLPGADRPIGP